jgi:hypothetical protein
MRIKRVGSWGSLLLQLGEEPDLSTLAQPLDLPEEFDL